MGYSKVRKPKDITNSPSDSLRHARVYHKVQLPHTVTYDRNYTWWGLVPQRANNWLYPTFQTSQNPSLVEWRLVRCMGTPLRSVIFGPFEIIWCSISLVIMDPRLPIIRQVNGPQLCPWYMAKCSRFDVTLHFPFNLAVIRHMLECCLLLWESPASPDSDCQD